jgi:hypothetical protein
VTISESIGLSCDGSSEIAQVMARVQGAGRAWQYTLLFLVLLPHEMNVATLTVGDDIAGIDDKPVIYNILIRFGTRPRDEGIGG